MMFSVPVAAQGTGGPLMDEVLVKCYPDNAALFDALIAGDIDLMAWPLVKSQYDIAKTNPEIQMAPYQELGMYQIDINNNKTLPGTDYPSPTADESFRQALAFCVDKNGLVAFTGGFGCRIDTPMARPILNNWVAFPPDPLCRSEYDAAENEIFEYPYEYNPNMASVYLDNDGFVAGQTTNPDYDPQYAWSSPTIRVYPQTQVVWDYWHIADEPTGHELPAGQLVYEVMLEWPVEGDWTLLENLKVYYNGMMANCYPFSALLRPVIDYEVVGLLLIIHVNMSPPPPCAGDTVPPLPGCEVVCPAEDSFKFYAEYKVHHPKAGLNLDPLLAYVDRGNPSRKWAGESLVDHMRKLGIPVALTENKPSVIMPPVMGERKYHIYAGGWSMSTYPTHFYALYTELGIYEWGPNYPQVEYPDVSYWAKVEYLSTRDPTFAEAIYAAKVCQAKLVDYCACIWLYSSTGYMAYRTGWLNVINARGYGLEGALLWTSLMCYNVNPLIKRIRYGVIGPPNKLNPIFFQWKISRDYEVMDNIFGWLMLGNPYVPTTPGKSPGGGDLPYLAKDWSYWVEDPENEAHVRYCLSDAFTWHDGTPVTAYDVNYTIWLTASYPDAWACDAVADLKDVIVWGPYDIEIVYKVPSIWAIYFFYPYILPKHIYETIPDHHGYTPGDLPEEVVLCGYGPWKYDSGDRTTYALLVANRDFPLTPVRGDIDLNYFWTSTKYPSGGTYKIGLADLVMVAKAYCGRGETASTEPPGHGPTGNWETGCDVAAPCCHVGLTDLVTVCKVYEIHWGEYDP
jgi:ABC-type transport system substrate-binding protein